MEQVLYRCMESHIQHKYLPLKKPVGFIPAALHAVVNDRANNIIIKCMHAWLLIPLHVPAAAAVVEPQPFVEIFSIPPLTSLVQKSHGT